MHEFSNLGESVVVCLHGDGDSSVVRAPGLETERSRVQIPVGGGGRIFFSRVNFLC